MSRSKIKQISYGYDRHERLWYVSCWCEDPSDDFMEWMAERRHCELLVEEFLKENPGAKAVRYKPC